MVIFINLEHPPLHHPHEVFYDKPTVSLSLLWGDVTSRGSFTLRLESKHLKECDNINKLYVKVVTTLVLKR